MNDSELETMGQKLTASAIKVGGNSMQYGIGKTVVKLVGSNPWNAAWSIPGGIVLIDKIENKENQTIDWLRNKGGSNED